jgi:hypothetical protein
MPPDGKYRSGRDLENWVISAERKALMRARKNRGSRDVRDPAR